MSIRHPSIQTNAAATYGAYFYQGTPPASETAVTFADTNDSSVTISTIPCGQASTISVYVSAVTNDATVKLYGRATSSAEWIQLGSTITGTAGTPAFTVFEFVSDAVAAVTECYVSWSATSGGATSAVALVLK